MPQIYINVHNIHHLSADLAPIADAHLGCQIVRDLVDAAIVTTRAKLRRQMRADIAAAVEERILDSLIGTDGPSTTRVCF